MSSTITALTSGGGLAMAGDTSGQLQLLTNNGTAAVTIDTSQNVGINQTSPTVIATAKQLAIKAPTNGDALFVSQNSNGLTTFIAGYYGVTAGPDKPVVGSYSNDPVAFITNNTERMRLTTGGFTKMTNSGSYLGATGSYHEMRTSNNDVIAYFTNSGASAPYGLDMYFSAAAPNNASQWFHLCEDTGGVRFVAMSNGGIKNYSANNVNLSDETVKKDINLAGNYLDKVCAIPVKTFLYVDQTDTDLNLGVIAQDVQAVAPELVTTTDWGTKEVPDVKLSVYESDLMFALMKSIQELNAKITALEEQVINLGVK